jgi:immune inhibitor A
LRQNRGLIFLGSTVAILVCCFVAMCNLAGFYLWLADSRQVDELGAQPDVQYSTPIPTPIHREPLTAERQTARDVTDSLLPQRDLVDLARRLEGFPPTFQVATPDNPPVYNMGQAQVFWLHNVNANSFFTTTAILKYETPHAYWWVEDSYSISQKDLEESAWRFENGTYPTNRRLFGTESTPGIDADSHIYIFLGNVPGVGGYFSSPDEYPSEIRHESNEHEMFYINLDNAQPGDTYFDGILAHEFQHMIHWAMDQNEDTWVNEGLSELAGQINEYDVGGSEWLFLTNPDTQLTTWPELEDSGAHYGASYLFLSYFLERYGEEAVRQLVAEPANGIAGFDAVLARIGSTDRQFRDLFSDWVIANYLDHADPAGGLHGYAKLELDGPAHAAHHTAYPLQQEATVHQYGTDYILLEGKRTLTIDFTGSQVVSLVGNRVHSGDYQWWSKRGDEGDTTLTRAFDLSDLQQATLQVWMWYDLETDYDYAYVEVSVDGGRTWTILGNEHTTTANPSGNSYGPGFTGLSGGADEPRWSRERFDLTPYVGQSVLVRFEVVTDDTVNHPGFCLDDISIPELSYHTDVEAGPDGWQAEGWVRVTEHVPQEFIVQLLTLGDQTRLERVTLDNQMHGTAVLTGLGQDVDRAVLVVSALAPSTTELATYSYQIAEE